MELLYFSIVCFVSISITFKVIRDTKGCCYAGPDVLTDNEKMVRAANEVKFYQWPSKMHNIKYNRGQLREYWVLCLKILGKFKSSLQNKRQLSDYTYLDLRYTNQVIAKERV